MPAWVMGGVLGVAASAILVVIGLRMQRAGWVRAASISLGVLGLLLSVGWLILAAYADAVVE